MSSTDGKSNPSTPERAHLRKPRHLPPSSSHPSIEPPQQPPSNSKGRSVSTPPPLATRFCPPQTGEPNATALLKTRSPIRLPCQWLLCGTETLAPLSFTSLHQLFAFYCQSMSHSRMSARDFIRSNATPNDEALMTYESEQICAYADLENADFILQSKRYLHSGLDLSTPSMLLNSAQKLDSVENATGVFKGEKPYIVIATELINLDDAITPGEHLIRMLPTLGTLAYVVFDLEPKQLVYDGLKLAEKLPWNLDRILLNDRKISSVATGLNKQWFAWIPFSTHISRHSNRQPRFKSLGLQTPGRSPND